MIEKKTTPTIYKEVQGYFKNKIEIKDIHGAVLFVHECENNNIKLTVEEAVRQKIDLKKANLIGADLREANLIRADLIGANLHLADLKTE